MIELIIFIDGVFYNAIGLFFVSLGVLVLIRHTGFPDLTVDGSFTIGAAVFASSLVAHSNLFLSILLCFIFGFSSGLITVFINQFLGITKIISGVVTMTVLVLVSPYIAGKSTIGLLHLDDLQEKLSDLDKGLSVSINLFSYSLHFYQIIFWGASGVIISVFLYKAMASNLGTRLRYVGSSASPSMMTKPKTLLLTFIGLGCGNGLVAIGGAIEAVRRGAYTSNMGIGTILIGLTILVLGESLLKIWVKRDYIKLHEQILAIIFGLLAYSILLQIILRIGFSAVDLKLVTTLMLLILLSIAGRFFPNSGRLF